MAHSLFDLATLDDENELISIKLTGLATYNADASLSVGGLMHGSISTLSLLVLHGLVRSIVSYLSSSAL